MHALIVYRNKKKIYIKQENVKMRCPKHPEVWLYENMMETKGFCPKCGEWYELEDNKSKVKTHAVQKPKR